MIVLRVKTRDGLTLGFCSARCYAAAPGSPCVCICRGRNHSKGPTVALANAAEISRQWGEVAIVERDERTYQQTLFDLENDGP